MTGCDVVYYCVVDTRGWLRDPAPLFHTNVEGTHNVLEVAKEHAKKFGVLDRYTFGLGEMLRRRMPTTQRSARST
jgi:nucleoside-diphosphate-sugar epimerase